MSRIHALKFLILQTLNKNKSQISGDLHIEIAKSLSITSKKECLIVTWMSKGNNKEITIDNSKFNFYKKSEFDQTSNNKQIDVNESNARDLVLKIIKLSLQ